MRGLAVILMLVLFHLSEGHTAFKRGKQYFPVSASVLDDASCEQAEADCEECLAREETCEWCVGASSSECRKPDNCADGNRATTCSPAQVRDEKLEGNWKVYDKSLDELQAMDPPETYNYTAPNGTVVTVNASVLCGRQDACNNCTTFKFCYWCESKGSQGSCEVFIDSKESKHACKKDGAFEGQCLYPIGVTPCNRRKKNCKSCLDHDSFCYWCATTEKCEYYPGGKYEPETCPSDKWYHDGCPMVEDLLWVLLPIIAIILIPLLIYLIIWLICCCMRAAGYEPLTPMGGDPNQRKHPKGIRLRPGSPSNKTDQLREKYGLGNP